MKKTKKNFFKTFFKNSLICSANFKMGNKNCSRCIGNGYEPLSPCVLSENEIDLLLKSTDMTRDQIVDFHQNFLQDCPNGVITKKEFVRMFKQLHSNESRKEKAEKFTEYVFKYTIL